MVSLLTQTYGLLPGYHMNKKHWISVLLDNPVGEARILDFLDMSYDLIDNEKMKKRQAGQNKSGLASRFVYISNYSVHRQKETCWYILKQIYQNVTAKGEKSYEDFVCTFSYGM